MITQFGVSQDPNDNPFSKGEEGGVRVLWDCATEQVIDGGEVSCGLFDTHWVYIHRPSYFCPWILIKYEGMEPVYLHDKDVPELVQLAAMVSS